MTRSMPSMRAALLALAIAGSALVTPSAVAQGSGAAAPPRNEQHQPQGKNPDADRATLVAIFEQLGKASTASADFVEIRTLGELDMPIESRGQLRFEPPATLIKQTTQPVQETLRLSGDSLSVTMGDTTRELPLEAVPAAAALATALRGLLAGRLAEVEEQFTTRFEGDRQDWQLQLEPRDAKVAASMKKLVVHGLAAQIVQIDLRQTNGDGSMLRILNTP